jgi:hypothetical protein
VEGGQNKIEEIDFSGSKSSRPITFDASAYKDLERGFNWIFYPAVLLIAYLVFAVALAFCASVYALVGLMLASLMGSSLEFAALCRIGTHAQTAGCLLYAMDMLLPWALPGRIYASITISLTLLWLGTRAAVRAAANPTAPA